MCLLSTTLESEWVGACLFALRIASEAGFPIIDSKRGLRLLDGKAQARGTPLELSHLIIVDSSSLAISWSHAKGMRNNVAHSLAP